MRQPGMTLEQNRAWYSDNDFALEQLTTEELDTIEKIVKGDIDSNQLPEQIKRSPLGFSADYNRTIASEVLQILDISRSFEPILAWIKNLGEDKDYRHWTSCMNAMDRFAVFLKSDEFTDKLQAAIPYLKQIAMDYDPKHKGYPEYAIEMIASIGGNKAKKALEYVRDNSNFDPAKITAERELEILNYKSNV